MRRRPCLLGLMEPLLAMFLQKLGVGVAFQRLSPPEEPWVARDSRTAHRNRQ